MLRITKNKLGNFFKACLIVLLMIGWLFCGWPRLLEFSIYDLEFRLPPTIQKAQASQTIETYAFATTSESWTGNDGVSTTDTYRSDVGNLAGCLQTSVAGKNKTNTTAGWLISGISWEDLGVPAGATVNSVDGNYDWQCSDYTNGQSTSTSGNLTVTDASDGNETTLETGTTFGSTTTWATQNLTAAVAMPAALQASNTSIKIKLLGNLRTSAGSAGVARQMDNVVLTINYTLSASITVPTSVQMPDYTLGGVGYTDRNFNGVAGLVQITASAGFTVTVSSTNLTSANNTISNADVRLRTDGTVTSNPTVIENCTGFSGITETSNGEYALDSAQTIVTTSSGSGTCDIYPTIRVYINNYDVYIEEVSGVLTFTVS